MKRFALNSVICGCLLWPFAATAQSPSYGVYTQSFIHTDRSENHPKKLQTAIAITEELALDGVPLNFNILYGGRSPDDPLASKGKVDLKVTVFRGEEVIWKGKRRRKVKRGDAWHSFCDAYNEGLMPGDIVVFDFKFRNVPSMGEAGGYIMGQVGPSEIWASTDAYPWLLPEFDCF